MKTPNYTQEARDTQRKLRQLQEAAPEMLKALQFYAQKGAVSQDKDDEIEDDCGHIARKVIEKATL